MSSVHACPTFSIDAEDNNSNSESAFGSSSSSASDCDAGLISDSSSEFEKPRRRPRERYYCSFCKRCQELEKIDPVPEPGDDDIYLFSPEREDEEFMADEGLKLRVIRYRKSLAKSGGFDVDCPPLDNGVGGIMLPRYHLGMITRDTEQRAKKCAQFVVDEYNQQESQNLEFLHIVNVCGIHHGRLVLYVTFEALHPQQWSDTYVETYQAVVSCFYRTPEKEIMIFRRKSDGKDLLPPDLNHHRRGGNFLR